MHTFDAESIEAIFRERFSAAGTVQLLWKGKESFQIIFDAVRAAQKTIYLEFYICRNDETGTELAELLKQKSREGVRVCLLYDHFGSFGTPKRFWNDLKAAGVWIRASRPFKWIAPFRYVHRDHKKLIVIDSAKAFTGGLNIANEYSGLHLKLLEKGVPRNILSEKMLGGRSGWRDTGIMLEGPVVNELLGKFKKSWYAWGGEPLGETGTSGVRGKEAQEKGIPVIPVFVSSARGRRRMRRLLYYSVNHARRSITLTTAYFTPSRRMVETLENAVNRGVRVRLLVPGRSDVPAASYAGRAFFARLLKAGVEIYTYAGEILHAKTSIFDECWSIVGSANLDFRSLRYNDEGNIGILDAGFAARMNEIFEEDLIFSERIGLETWLRRPFCEKAKEHFFSLFRRRL